MVKKEKFFEAPVPNLILPNYLSIPSKQFQSPQRLLGIKPPSTWGEPLYNVNIDRVHGSTVTSIG